MHTTTCEEHARMIAEQSRKIEEYSQVAASRAGGRGGQACGWMRRLCLSRRLSFRDFHVSPVKRDAWQFSNRNGCRGIRTSQGI
jgi:hypothetical protein